MPRCPYYKVESKTLRSREIHPAPPQTIYMPWCAHKHSPVSKLTATRTIGGANHLKCEGDLKKCPLTPAQLVDI
jgi:hypothetical protein